MHPVESRSQLVPEVTFGIPREQVVREAVVLSAAIVAIAALSEYPEFCFKLEHALLFLSLLDAIPSARGRPGSREPPGLGGKRKGWGAAQVSAQHRL